eukprot:gene16097-biopygen16603
MPRQETVHGAQLEVFWLLDDAWCPGDVAEISASRQHHIRYDDGDDEWLVLADERWRLLEQSEAPESQQVVLQGARLVYVEIVSKSCAGSNEMCGTLNSTTTLFSSTEYHLTCQSFLKQDAELNIEEGTVMHGYKTGSTGELEHLGALIYSGTRPVHSTCMLFKHRESRMPLECLAWYVHL